MLSSLVLTLSLAVASVYGVPSNSTLPKRAVAQVYTTCAVPNTAALTFDDGPFIYLYDVSKILVAAGAKGTFFFNGNNYGCIYDDDEAKRVKYAFDHGHQVSSHTWSHAHLTSLTFDQLHNQFWLVEDALMKITGAYPAFARPPYGEYNDLVQQVAGSRGQDLVNWDFDSGDSVGVSTADQMKRYDDLATARPSTVIALNHEVYQSSAQVVLPHAIKTLQSAGYRLVTLSECLGKPAYQRVGQPTPRDASWTCTGKPAPGAP